mmetsp:Transcript_32894/g.73825  ORF Transcript_32894/g.73825 Transcript_32894/m.73825 type:complete len:200 (-) Transcript_32894:82-681(-)
MAMIRIAFLLMATATADSMEKLSVGDFCGIADNGDRHVCGRGLQCVARECKSGGFLGGSSAYHPQYGQAPAVPAMGAGAAVAYAQWKGLNAADYLAEGAVCFPATTKVCAPWTGCYVHRTNGFHGAPLPGEVGHCMAHQVANGARCGKSPTAYQYIDVGRCGPYSFCKADAVSHPGLMGAGSCAQNLGGWLNEKLHNLV